METNIVNVYVYRQWALANDSIVYTYAGTRANSVGRSVVCCTRGSHEAFSDIEYAKTYHETLILHAVAGVVNPLLRSVNGY